jgi:SAM-dependent methyltransferase
MHDSSMTLMRSFANGLLGNNCLDVIDIGSLDVNGCYRELFAGHNYTGYDLAPGKNVDVVGKDQYIFPFEDNGFDVAVSGQTIEHVADMHKWIRQVARIVKPNGLICIIAPNTFHEHRYPIDCWRIFPDGMQFLLEEIAGLKIVVVDKKGIDTIGVGRKP